MLVQLYTLAPDVWSFTPEPGVAPIEVRVPAGSALLPIRSIGTMLFVRSESDPLIRTGWSANQIVRAAFGGSARFKLAGNPSQRVAV